MGISQSSRATSVTSSSNASSKSQFSASSGDDVSLKGEILPTPNLKEYTFQELKTATRNFKGETLLGERGFGKVYKGWLETKNATKRNSEVVVAIKKLNSESMQGFEEWQLMMLESPDLYESDAQYDVGLHEGPIPFKTADPKLQR